MSRYTTDGCTRGALSSNEGQMTTGSNLGKQYVKPRTALQTSAPVEQSISLFVDSVPSPGYSAVDYQPLALLREQTPSSPIIPSPSRE